MTMDIERQSLFTADGEDLMTVDGEDVPMKCGEWASGKKKSAAVVRGASIHLSHPQLFETYLPHRQMLHQSVGPRRMSIKPRLPLGDDALRAVYRPSILSQVFPLSFDEIADKKWLRTDIQAMLDVVIKQVDALSPFTFLLRYAPLHSIQESWKKMAPHIPRHPEGEYSSARLGKSSAESGVVSGTHDGSRRGRENCGRKRRTRADPAAVQKTLLDGLRDFLASESPAKLEMALLATPPTAVFDYVRGYLAKALPRKKVLGSKHNEKVFLHWLAVYLQTGMTDKLPVGCLVGEVNTEEVGWLKRSSAKNCHVMLAEFFVWVFSDVVNPLINRAFYVTSTQFRKNERLYFRREIWSMLCNKSVQEFVDQQFWRPLSTERHNDRLSELQDFLTISKDMQATYRTRFVPRDFGIRPLMIPRSIVGHDIHPYERTRRLRTTRLILNYIMERYPAMRGFGMENSADIEKRWMKFRRHRLETADHRPLFFVTCDIQKAYDSIDLPSLRKIIQKLYQKCLAKEMHFFFVYDLLQAARKEGGHSLPPGTSRYRVVSKEDYQEVAGLTELGEPICVELKDVFADISYMSVPAVFQSVKSKWYTFLRGVPQGCSLSCHFLNYYYGQLEMELGSTIGEDELMMRYMDDIVMMTPHLQRATAFIRGVSYGLPHIRLSINPSKTHTNLPGLQFHGIAQCSHNGMNSLCWYGWTFDLAGLSLKVDMRRYHAYRIRYCFSLNYADEMTISRSICAAMTGKFAVALFDLACGPRDIVIQNTYELFLLCAIHLLAYWQKAQRIVRQTKRVLRLIGILIRSLIQCILQRWESQSAIVLGEAQISALAWQAMVTVLCVEGKRWSPLRRGCRQQIMEKAMRMLGQLEEEHVGGSGCLIHLLTDGNFRFPISYRNCA